MNYFTRAIDKRDNGPFQESGYMGFNQFAGKPCGLKALI